MDGAVALSVAAESEPKSRFDGNTLIAAPHRDSRPRATDAVNCDNDSESALRFFEVNLRASAEGALCGIQWWAERNIPKRYRENVELSILEILHVWAANYEECSCMRYAPRT